MLEMLMTLFKGKCGFDDTVMIFFRFRQPTPARSRTLIIAGTRRIDISGFSLANIGFVIGITLGYVLVATRKIIIAARFAGTGSVFLGSKDGHLC